MFRSQVGFPRSVVKLGLSGAVAVFFLIACAPGRAASFSYRATDLADTTPGEDLWLYMYRVSGFTFGADEGFTITFDRTFFNKLQSPPPVVNADWDALTLQPDLALSSNGFYDAQAQRAAPSLANDFNVTAVWLGTGSPGAQPFTIYDSSFAPLEQGQTVPIPEPSTPLLLGVAALYGLRATRRRFPSARSAFPPPRAPRSNPERR